MKARIVILLLIIIIGCCKDPIPVIDDPVDPIIGSWNIVSVDSGNYPLVPNSSFQFRKNMGLSGIVTIDEDGTGLLSGEATLISCNQEYFSWVKNDSLELIYINYNEHFSTSGKIQKISKDSLVFDYRDYCRGGQMYTGVHIYYRITAIKTN